MLIVNLGGTSELTCVCGSWLDHWKKFSAQTVRRCTVKKCSGSELVGAHVRLAGTNDPAICPICKSCNNQTGFLDVEDNVVLVSAIVRQTCGRRSS
jgi:hypothetical protein